MNCFQCERNLSAYLDDELPLDERVELEGHLDECQACRAEFAGHQAAWEAAHRVAAEAAPDGLWEGVESRLGAEGHRAGMEELTLMVKGLASEVQELRRTVDGLRRDLAHDEWGEAGHGEAYGRDATDDIRVRANPFRPEGVAHPREARQPATIEQLRRSS